MKHERNHALNYSVLYGPGDNDAAHRAKFTLLGDATEFAEAASLKHAQVTLSSKVARIANWRNGDRVK